MLKGKNILIGICGSIAAYKTTYLIRELVKEGANVRIILTADALSFVTPLTLSTLSKNPVLSEYFDSKTGVWNNHVELSGWADLFLIAPITANTLAKLSHGLCDNLLSACFLSYTNPILLAPAMDLEMWKHPATVSNIERLERYGNHIIEPEYGELASGLVGQGRLAETDQIMKALRRFVPNAKADAFTGKKVLVTAGPTYEPIDPVRFIGNRSSGKMGFSIAQYMQEEGAEVILITGPSNQSTPPGVTRIDVLDSNEMLANCLQYFPSMDITIMSAAVSDYRSIRVAKQKIKKEDPTFTLELEKTTDILSTLGTQKRPGQILIGFALETEQEETNAKRKLQKKKLDFIVLNSLRNEDAGFDKNTNKVTIIRADGTVTDYPTKSKMQVARDIGAEILKLK